MVFIPFSRGKSACSNVMIRSKASGNAIGLAMHVFTLDAMDGVKTDTAIPALLRKQMGAKR